ncbi:MAG: hypothetical protein KAI83_19930 [Thiomargarita sp.]|nr:hypothetical protein [Thiomargarita sp.]
MMNGEWLMVNNEWFRGLSFLKKKRKPRKEYLLESKPSDLESKPSDLESKPSDLDYII